MSDTLEARQLIVDVMQRGYGDATQCQLDFKVASDIVDALLKADWCPPNVLSAIVESVGGEIKVLRKHLADPPEMYLFEVRDSLYEAFILKTKKSEN